VLDILAFRIGGVAARGARVPVDRGLTPRRSAPFRVAGGAACAGGRAPALCAVIGQVARSGLDHDAF
jgi:hypothetical protein